MELPNLIACAHNGLEANADAASHEYLPGRKQGAACGEVSQNKALFRESSLTNR